MRSDDVMLMWVLGQIFIVTLKHAGWTRIGCGKKRNEMRVQLGSGQLDECTLTPILWGEERAGNLLGNQYKVRVARGILAVQSVTRAQNKREDPTVVMAMMRCWTSSQTSSLSFSSLLRLFHPSPELTISLDLYIRTELWVWPFLLKTLASTSEIQPLFKPKHRYIIVITELRHKRLTYNRSINRLARVLRSETFCLTSVNFLGWILGTACCSRQNTGTPDTRS